MLEAVARQVQPILRRRKFTVPLLKEFYPRNRGLLVSARAAPGWHGLWPSSGVACGSLHPPPGLEPRCTSPALVPICCTSWQGLNVGGGGGHTREICVRLRPAGRDSDFFPFEHVLGTMLHEITHNVVRYSGYCRWSGQAQRGVSSNKRCCTSAAVHRSAMLVSTCACLESLPLVQHG